MGSPKNACSWKHSSSALTFAVSGAVVVSVIAGLAAIWEHRAVGLGQIPGKLRYETLKRAAASR